MRAYARRMEGDEDLWGATGLIHDFDYEKHPTPTEHPFVGCKILEERGYPREMIEAILGHATYSGTPRVTPMAKTLFAVDELCGFLTACALVQPGKTLREVRVPSVRKKLKDKHFAKGVDRDHVIRGAAELGVDLDDHIAFVLESLREAAPALGLG